VPTTLSPAMAARYGEGRSSGRLVLGVVVLAVVFLAILAYVTFQLATSSVHSQLIRFSVVDAHRVDVTFEVDRSGDQATTCVLRAQDVEHSDVAYATVTVTPGAAQVQATYPLATNGLADTAEVLGCADGQAPRVDAPQFAPGTTNPAQQPTIDGRAAA
jgi:Domain of unknown function (DUF4307)